MKLKIDLERRFVIVDEEDKVISGPFEDKKTALKVLDELNKNLKKK